MKIHEQVRAAEKAEQNLQKDIVLVQQPSETGMQFARELAAAEAAQEALYAELAPLATPETPPGALPWTALWYSDFFKCACRVVNTLIRVTRAFVVVQAERRVVTQMAVAWQCTGHL